jgi:hypothetical protein
MTKAQMEKLREIAEMVDQHGIDELIEKRAIQKYGVIQGVVPNMLGMTGIHVGHRLSRVTFIHPPALGPP